MREQCGPDFHITYTVPALTESVDPWMKTMRDSIEYMDAINIMAYDVYWEGYDWLMDIAALEELGVPRVLIMISRFNVSLICNLINSYKSIYFFDL